MALSLLLLPPPQLAIICAIFELILMDSIKVPASGQITLRSTFNQKYLGYRNQSQSFAAAFPPLCASPVLKNMGRVDRALKFEVQPQYGENNGWVTEGSRVLLVHRPPSEEEDEKHPDLYLTCTARNEVKFDKKTSNEESNKMLLKSALWTISYAAFQKELIPPSRSDLTVHDSLVLKSVYGSYLTVHAQTLACTTQPEMDEARSVWNIHLAASLPLPSWLFQKPSFGKFLKPESSENLVTGTRRTLRANTPEVQEMLLVEDLLDVMLGFEGTYIRKRPGTAYYVIQPHLESPSCSTALAQLTYRVLELPSFYERLMRFMREQEYRESLLSQALCDGLKEMVYQYYQQVMQLDERQAQGGLTLQTLWVEVQDALKVLRALGDLVAAAAGLKGGQLLSCLLKLQAETTDRHVLFIYKHLYGRLTKLYLKMLGRWIYEGRLDDRHGEFMVWQDEKTGAWSNWEERFLLRADMVPSVLQRDAQTILVTGKYINILRACNREAVCPLAGEVEGEQGGRIGFTEPIQRAYEWANQQLKQLVFGEWKLQEVLSSLKGYFFLSFGDLFLHFLDAAQDDLALPKKLKSDGRRQFSLQKLQNLFQLNVRTSSAANDTYKEEVSLKLENQSVFQQMHRIKTMESEVFGFNFSEKPFLKKDARYVDFVTLDFRVGFPLSLVLNKRAIAKYQCLFRHLFWFKYLERQLNLCWVKLQNTSESNVECFRVAYTTNHRLMHFLKTFIYYLTEEVIEMNWIRLTEELAKASNFQQIIAAHQRFLNACLKESLLTNQNLLTIIASDIGNIMQNYFQIKDYLSDIQAELNVFKDSHPVPTHQRRDYLRQVQQQVADLVEEKRFLQFVTLLREGFDELFQRFKNEVSQSTAKEQSHLLRLSQMFKQEREEHHQSLLP